jgi:hypothetical protein
MKPKMQIMGKEAKRTKQSETKRNFLFICFSKIMQNGLPFEFISHGSEKKNKSEKGAL